MKHHEHPAWNQGRNAHHDPEHNLEIVKVLVMVIAATFAPIAFVWLVVALVEAFA